jgi:hypothetical protein
VLGVIAAVMYMMAPKGTNLKKLDTSWAAGKKLMGSVDAFLVSLQQFDKDNFLIENKEFVRKFTGPADNPNPEFTGEFMQSKSGAAAGMCDWIVNIVIYHDIYLDVEPKRQKLNEAVEQLNAANKKLQAVRAHVQGLEDRKAELGKLLEDSTNEKVRLPIGLTIARTTAPTTTRTIAHTHTLTLTRTSSSPRPSARRCAPTWRSVLSTASRTRASAGRTTSASLTRSCACSWATSSSPRASSPTSRPSTPPSVPTYGRASGCRTLSSARSHRPKVTLPTLTPAPIPRPYPA